ncbi:MAG: MraY family glycosyltransferase [Candidatus Coatesbacteria bacterium]
MAPTFIAFASALVLALALTPLARRIAFRTGVIDRPDRGLKRHRAPVPYLGGVAIFLAVIVTVVAVKLADGEGPLALRIRGVVGLLAGAGIVFLLGLWDDVSPLRPKVKLAIQAVAALVPISLGVHIKFVDNPWVAMPLTLVWMVGITNAFNLLDIMDGLAAGVACVASLWFWVISAQHGRFNDALTAAALAGATLGFLNYNRAPARIFMGDAGALFLGFLLSAVAIGQGYSMNTNLGVIAPLLVLGVPIFETLFVMAVRRQQGKPVMMGSPDHVPLRLVKIGYTRERAVVVLWVVGALLGALAWFVVQANWERALLVSGVVVMAAMSAAVRLASVRMEETRR